MQTFSSCEIEFVGGGVFFWCAWIVYPENDLRLCSWVGWYYQLRFLYRITLPTVYATLFSLFSCLGIVDKVVVEYKP